MITFVGHIGAALIAAFLLGLDPFFTVIGGMLPDADVFAMTLKMKWEKVHRKFTHSLVFIFIFLLASLVSPLFLALAVGILTHYFMDTDHWGLPLFYPFSLKRYSLLKVDQRNMTKGPKEGITKWFKKHDAEFYVEFVLLAIGIILNWEYIRFFVSSIFE